jgi:peptidoglycan hydrolase CwlO-like protein
MEQRSEIKRLSITLGELLMASLVILGSVLTFWISTTVRLNSLESRMNTSEKKFDNIDNKLDKITEGVNDLKVTLQNKADKKDN